MIDDLVAGERREVTKHQLGDWAHAPQRQPDGRACDGLLADGRREDALGKARREALRRLEGAAVGVQNVLAQHDNGGVIRHRRREAVAHALQIGLGYRHEIRSAKLA